MSKITSQVGSDRTIQSGYCLKFQSGSDSYVDINSVDKGIKSIVVWVRSDSLTQYILDTGDGYISMSSGELATNIATPTYYINSVFGERTIGTSSWSHFVITTTNTGITASNIDIGRFSTNYFTGSITDLRFYSDILTAAEIEDLYQGKRITDNLVIHFPMSETTGSVLHDASGNRNSGSLENTPTWIPQNVSANLNNWSGYNDSGSYQSSSLVWPTQLDNGVLIPPETNLIDVYGHNLYFTGRCQFNAYLVTGSLI